MKPESYARAIWKLLQKGESPKDVIARLSTALEARGRGALMTPIGRAFERLAAREAFKNRNVLLVARMKDQRSARKASGAENAECLEDKSLIGGWRLESGDQLIDKTWKHHLLSIYGKVVSQ